MNRASPVDRAFEALANSCRRQLLLALHAENPNEDETFDPVALLEQRVAADELQNFRSRLHHVHLPKLAQLRLVDWDEVSGTLSTGADWHQVDTILALFSEHRIVAHDVSPMQTQAED